jgi:hypothetical protein
MERKTKNRWAGFIVGPAMVFIALGAIWKNETRFDYHQAAKKTEAVQTRDQLISGQNFSYTGPMDQQLVIEGDYVDSFTGYLMVQRSAEIYAWDKDTDSEGHTTWSRRWMSSLESNSRNSGIRQELSSNRFTPMEYQVGDLTIEGARIEFVDDAVAIGTRDLELVRTGLERRGNEFYLAKGGADGLGDERVRYTGVPVPAVASYFGMAAGGQGVADTSNIRTGWINAMIQDTGILHHIVAGERETALATMKAHIGKVKWIVRGVASVGVIVGFNILFGTVLGFLYSMPLIGGLARSGSFILSLVLGLPLILITMLGGYLVANPLVLAVVLAAIGGGVFLLRRRKQETQQAVQQELERQYGPQMETLDMKELEFIELAKLVFSDGRFDPKEEKFLRKWSRKEGWDGARFTEMLAKAKEMSSGGPPSLAASEEHLKNLIRLALADGHLSSSELSTIQHAAKRLGYDQGRIARLTQQVQQLASQKAAQPA